MKRKNTLRSRTRHARIGMKGGLCALALAGLLSGSPARAQVEEQTAPGSVFPRRCGICHLDKAPAAPPGVIAFTAPPRSSGPGERGMCYSCHNGLVRDSRRGQWTGRHHPASGGGVQCGSCHSPHIRTPGVGPFMKYEPGNYSFCVSCHPGRRKGEPGEHPIAAGGKGKPQDCGSCHVVHKASGDGLIKLASAEALCGPCHGENPSRDGRGPGKTTHLIGGKGPVCLACHSIHRTGSKDLLTKAVLDGRICRQCHEKTFSMKKAEGNHPVSPPEVSCFSCHRIHNAADPDKGKNRLLTVASADLEKLCRQCHEDLAASGAAWNHPLGVGIGDNKNSQGLRLFSYGAFFAPGTVVTCLSCHKTHEAAAGTPGLVVAKQALCLYCHPKQNSLDMERALAGAHPVSVRPRFARINEAFLKAGGEVGRQGELICLTCHRAHGGVTGTPGMVLLRESYSCLLCHKDEGSIASTIHGMTGGEAGICAGCHGEHGWKFPISGDREKGTAIEQICAKCHRSDGIPPFSEVTNHPIGITPPPGAAPASFPLFWKDGRRFRQGVITCATCHDVHRNPRGNFLRAGRGEKIPELCVGCHDRELTVIGTKHDLAPEGGSTCGSCHPVHDPEAAASWPDPQKPGGRAVADPESSCNQCHREGGRAGGKLVRERTHPAASGAPGESGAVTAVSCKGCHDPHRWNPSDPDDRGSAAREGDAGTSFLVRPAAGEAELCTGCHRSQGSVTSTPHDLSALARREALPPEFPDPRRHGVCGVCHKVHGAGAPYLWTPVLSGTEGARSEPCEHCHTAAGIASAERLTGYSHPVGVSPGKGTGTDLPLYGTTGRREAAGQIGCGTCHDPHSWSQGEGGKDLPKASRSFLRLSADSFAPLCFPCHADQSMVVGSDHDLRVTAPTAVNRDGVTPEASGVCGVCHVMHAAPGPIALWNRDLGEGKDLQSKICRSCHRPGEATRAKVPPRVETHMVNYPGRGLVERLFSITRINAREGASLISPYTEEGVRAEKGYLSCATCHDVHHWEPDISRSGEGLPVEGTLLNSFLRVPGTLAFDRSFCTECHHEASYFREYHFLKAR